MAKQIDNLLGIPSSTSNQSSVPTTEVNETRQALKEIETLLNSREQEKIDEDFDDARDSIKKSLNVAQDAIEKIILLANETEKHQYFDVLNKYLNTMATNSKALLDIYDAKNKAKADQKKTPDNVNNGTVVNVNNAVFTGTPKDLKRLVDDKKIISTDDS